MKSYHIQQKITPLANRYIIYELTKAGEKGGVVAYAEQKRLAFREKFTMFTDESRKTVALEIQARSVVDLGARYDVKDADGNVLGVIGKDFKSSLLRSTWNIYTPGNEKTPVLQAQERSKNIAILRRVWELLPFIGEIPFFIKYHFDFIDPVSNNVCATYNKTTTITDNYQLAIQDTGTKGVDDRVLLSLCVMMDALQSR